MAWDPKDMDWRNPNNNRNWRDKGNPNDNKEKEDKTKDYSRKSAYNIIYYKNPDDGNDINVIAGMKGNNYRWMDGNLLRDPISIRNNPNEWVFPGGNVENNENFESTADNELMQETGLTRKGDFLFSPLGMRQENTILPITHKFSNKKIGNVHDYFDKKNGRMGYAGHYIQLENPGDLGNIVEQFNNLKSIDNKKHGDYSSAKQAFETAKASYVNNGMPAGLVGMQRMNAKTQLAREYDKNFGHNHPALPSGFHTSDDELVKMAYYPKATLMEQFKKQGSYSDWFVNLLENLK